MSGGHEGRHAYVRTHGGVRAESSGPLHEYDFVNGTLVDAATLERAVGLARRWNVTPDDVMLTNGWIRSGAYYRALAGASRITASNKASATNPVWCIREIMAIIKQH